MEKFQTLHDKLNKAAMIYLQVIKTSCLWLVSRPSPVLAFKLPSTFSLTAQPTTLNARGSLKLRHHVITSIWLRNRLHHCLLPTTTQTSQLAPLAHREWARLLIISSWNSVRHIAKHHEGMTATKMTHPNNNEKEEVTGFQACILRLSAHPCTDHPQVPSPTRYVASPCHLWLLMISQTRRRSRSTTTTTATPKPPRWPVVPPFQVSICVLFRFMSLENAIFISCSKVERAWPLLIPMVRIYSILPLISRLFHPPALSSELPQGLRSPRQALRGRWMQLLWWWLATYGIDKPQASRRQKSTMYQQTHFTDSRSTITKIFRHVTTAFIRINTILHGTRTIATQRSHWRSRFSPAPYAQSSPTISCCHFNLSLRYCITSSPAIELVSCFRVMFPLPLRKLFDGRFHVTSMHNWLGFAHKYCVLRIAF